MGFVKDFYDDYISPAVPDALEDYISGTSPGEFVEDVGDVGYNTIFNNPLLNLPLQAASDVYKPIDKAVKGTVEGVSDLSKEHLGLDIDDVSMSLLAFYGLKNPKNIPKNMKNMLKNLAKFQLGVEGISQLAAPVGHAVHGKDYDPETGFELGIIPQLYDKAMFASESTNPNVLQNQNLINDTEYQKVINLENELNKVTLDFENTFSDEAYQDSLSRGLLRK